MNGMALDGEIRGFLLEAAEWHLLARLLERPTVGWRERVRILGEQVGNPTLCAVAQRARTEADEGVYLALLGPGGVASPRAACTSGFEDPGKVLAGLRGAYEAFAYRGAGNEAPDHVSVMADFVAFLLVKQAYAHSRDELEHARACAECAGWVRERIAGMAPALATRLETESAPEYLVAAVRTLAALAGDSGDGVEPRRWHEAAAGGVAGALPRNRAPSM